MDKFLLFTRGQITWEELRGSASPVTSSAPSADEVAHALEVLEKANAGGSK